MISLWRSTHNRNPCNLRVSVPGRIGGRSSRCERRQQEQHQSPEYLIKNQAGRLGPWRGNPQMSLFSPCVTLSLSLSVSLSQDSNVYTYRFIPGGGGGDTHEKTLQCIFTQRQQRSSIKAEIIIKEWIKEKNVFKFRTSASRLALKPRWEVF